MIKLKINNETDKLRAVILGLPPLIPENPSRHDDLTERDIKQSYEMLVFKNALESNNITVYRPERIFGMENKIQIFTRDIGFVIGNYFIKSNMRYPDRAIEYETIKKITAKIDEDKILTPPYDADIEGGDVILWNKYIFVGISARTNMRGYEFIKETFKDREVIPLKINLSSDPSRNILHLDCTFQPVGKKHAIIYEEGFDCDMDPIYDLFKNKNLIRISKEEQNILATNVLSINEQTIISGKLAKWVNNELKRLGFVVIEVPYYNVSRCGGSFRCSTLPLIRGQN